jgi:ATP-dependent Clp protease ATP-binding subunit ClpA
VQGVFGIGRSPNPFGELSLTRRAKKVIELAMDEARSLKHHYIGTEHLLLAMLFEGEGLAAQVLVAGCGLQISAMRELVLQILQEPPTIAVPEIPEQAATLLGENEPGVKCSRCGAHSPEYFRYCFHCGLKFL